ncbi:DUF899 domain-containing protein [Aggregicoccus sp. 17bor-14]|uniref:DUF899 domain-containing protein n=1 Tax=Myxococcaceae TaxID=31 RepID=UPI00129CEB51|nr:MULTISPECIES: DUF899 domain-containing protein [Myxococcaceae]MBF5043798.1 DUF899 domain-containing protein [Simulacricoccus sp. 17bor-14]MRI89551.1 DUF899 domain-containing protein [Aggregicoccus sp. 17bor-14]
MSQVQARVGEVEQRLRPAEVGREAWLEARKALLAREKAFTRERDALSAARRALPMVRVGKRYVFDGPEGPRTLAELFEGRRQLIVYHFMFGPDWEQGCRSCSYVADNFAGGLVHLAARDTAFAAISRAPLAKLRAFQQRMGWSFRWLSSAGSDFNYDFHVSFRPGELAAKEVEYNYARTSFPHSEAPGVSVFLREGDAVFHTYSTYARGLDLLMNTYNYLDLTPLGRQEDADAGGMAWVRHHDRYEGP